MQISKFIKKTIFILCILPQTAWAQDSIKNIFLKGVTINSTRTNADIESMAASVDVLNKNDMESFPISNIDNILQSISNVYVNRSWGIFSKNSSVTMRGMDGTNRVLVLYNGIPLNKTSGGGINWYIIAPETVEKVEVIKGSNSALYGNNAMSGIINIVTKMPEDKFAGTASLLFATYNTIGGRLNLSGNQIKENKGWYWYVNGFYRKGDGYINVPETLRDSSDCKLKMNEVSSDIKIGYQFNSNTRLSINYNFYHDQRSDGIKIFESDGSLLTDYSNVGMMDFTTLLKGNIQFQAKTFYHYDYFWQHTERLNETGDIYKLYDTDQSSNDYGIWMNASKNITKNYKLTLGVDLKQGDMKAEDTYRTSTDHAIRQGEIGFAAIFAQNELQITKKYMLVAALRYDYAKFFNGSFSIENPTYNTGFTTSYTENYASNNWFNISPKVSLKYFVHPKLDVYASFSQGFMPGTLDDMCSSKKITKGFKLANPNLKPEYVTSYEIGCNYKPINNLLFESSLYYSRGKDFQYFVATGEVIDLDKIVLKRENIGKVNIYGFETSMKYQLTKNLLFKANYTYNHSEIVEFNAVNETGKNLQGKFIAEIPPHQVFAGAFLKTKWVNASAIFNYISQQWADEQNATVIDPYSTIDIRLSRQFFKHVLFAIDIQNILDHQYIDKKGGLAPGRFIELDLGIKF
ncbi:MAG: TonB-dependent receptor [Bacteroidetes bacterium]|nr:TonB-dependent receptor [Bacteroidota bacterium]